MDAEIDKAFSSYGIAYVAYGILFISVAFIAVSWLITQYKNKTADPAAKYKYFKKYSELDF